MMQMRTRVKVEEVGNFDGSPGAVFLCDGKRVTVTGLTEHEARELGKRLYTDMYITVADFYTHPDPTGKTREPPHCPTCNCDADCCSACGHSKDVCEKAALYAQDGKWLRAMLSSTTDL